MQILFQCVDGNNGPVELIEDIVIGRDRIAHPFDGRPIKPGERDREPRPEFPLKLGEHRTCRHDEDPVGAMTQNEFRGYKSRFERFAETDIVGDKQPHTRLAECALYRNMLKRKIVDRGTAEDKRRFCCGRRTSEGRFKVELCLLEIARCVGNQGEICRIEKLQIRLQPVDEDRGFSAGNPAETDAVEKVCCPVLLDILNLPNRPPHFHACPGGGSPIL